MNFSEFREALIDAFAGLHAYPLVRTGATKHEMWQKYLSSFPEGTNPIYRENTVHDCVCCKQFIRAVGNLCAIKNGDKVSIWSEACAFLDPDSAYYAVAMAMGSYVESHHIEKPFYHTEETAGTHHNHSDKHGDIERYDHFYLEIPKAFVVRGRDIGTIISKEVSQLGVFERGLNEITLEAMDTVIELIAQKSLYRGDQYKGIIDQFRVLSVAYGVAQNKETFVWEAVSEHTAAITGIKNTAIGTLLIDLSTGVELDVAVGKFEAMVAPANYQRPKALVTKGMIKKAQEKVEELGMMESLPRRYAVLEDVSINNVLWANRTAQSAMAGNVFEEMIEEQSVNPKTLSKVEEIPIDSFMNEVLPHATGVEMLFENRLIGNLMSVIAPVNPTAPCMLKWDNNFSWTYNGELADSMKQRVKAAGGNVEGVMRFSIQWNDGEPNRCDYDAHCIEPSGNRIYFGHKKNNLTSGQLDVDIISPVTGKPAVENITWSNIRKMQKGVYKFRVHNYTTRTGNNGFTAEFEHNGDIRSYTYSKALRTHGFVDVITVDFDPEKDELKVLQEMPSQLQSRTEWGLSSNKFHPVSVMMFSPNHWKYQGVGNKHLFFILEGCKQEGAARGFYNEFLKDELRDSRKVFEMLGSKMKAEPQDRQLSGLGFSSTQRNHVYVRVSGHFNRVLKIVF
jgi:hypothetical protein